MAVFDGGRHTYGEAIGILMTNKFKPRIPGDVGNASTFEFPVRYRVVEEATGARHRRADSSLIEPFIRAAQELERDGVKAITSSCGFLALYQKDVADALSIPVFLSSLIQVPMVHRMIKRTQRIGVVTAEKQHLDRRYFDCVGASDVPIVVAGMEDQPEFQRAILQDHPRLDSDAIERETLEVCERMVKENPDIGAIVFECANLPPYSKAVQDRLHLPVFDIVTLTNMVFQAVVRRQFVGFM